MKVLVVDDSKAMLRIIVNVLNRLNINDVETAENGLDGLLKYSEASLSQYPFTTIITDWNMPTMNGLELVKKIREVNQEIHIIMVTTEGGKREVLDALKAGVNNYIVKPFTPQTLKEKLDSIM